MRVLPSAFGGTFLVAFALAFGAFGQGEAPVRLGGERPAWYALPGGYDGETQVPLLIVLHGYGSGSAEAVEFLELVDAADAAGVVLVAPDGSIDPRGRRYWNDADFCCDFFGSGVDDVGYLASLIGEARGAFSIDPARVYLIGHSNGGFMAHRFACDRSDLAAAIVSVAGATTRDAGRCGSPGPVALLQVHGTGDATIRYQGGEGYASVEEGAARWAGFNGCGEGPVAGEELDLVAPIGRPDAEVLGYPGCPAGLAVEIWSIRNGSHSPSFHGGWGDAVVGWLLAQEKARE